MMSYVWKMRVITIYGDERETRVTLLVHIQLAKVKAM